MINKIVTYLKDGALCAYWLWQGRLHHRSNDNQSPTTRNSRGKENRIVLNVIMVVILRSRNNPAHPFSLLPQIIS